MHSDMAPHIIKYIHYVSMLSNGVTQLEKLTKTVIFVNS